MVRYRSGQQINSISLVIHPCPGPTSMFAFVVALFVTVLPDCSSFPAALQKWKNRSYVIYPSVKHTSLVLHLLGRKTIFNLALFIFRWLDDFTDYWSPGEVLWSPSSSNSIRNAQHEVCPSTKRVSYKVYCLTAFTDTLHEQTFLQLKDTIWYCGQKEVECPGRATYHEKLQSWPDTYHINEDLGKRLSVPSVLLAMTCLCLHFLYLESKRVTQFYIS